MSKMAEIYVEIEQELEQGYRPSTISANLNVPITWVYQVLSKKQAEFDEPKFDNKSDK